MVQLKCVQSTYSIPDEGQVGGSSYELRMSLGTWSSHELSRRAGHAKVLRWGQKPQTGRSWELGL